MHTCGKYVLWVEVSGQQMTDILERIYLRETHCHLRVRPTHSGGDIPSSWNKGCHECFMSTDISSTKTTSWSGRELTSHQKVSDIEQKCEKDITTSSRGSGGTMDPTWHCGVVAGIPESALAASKACLHFHLMSSHHLAFSAASCSITIFSCWLLSVVQVRHASEE